MKKGKIRKLINLEEKDGKVKSIKRLNKRLNYIKSKLGKYKTTSNQIKYIEFHLKKLGVKI